MDEDIIVSRSSNNSEKFSLETIRYATGGLELPELGSNPSAEFPLSSVLSVLGFRSHRSSGAGRVAAAIRNPNRYQSGPLESRRHMERRLSLGDDDGKRELMGRALEPIINSGGRLRFCPVQANGAYWALFESECDGNVVLAAKDRAKKVRTSSNSRRIYWSYWSHFVDAYAKRCDIPYREAMGRLAAWFPVDAHSGRPEYPSNGNADLELPYDGRDTDYMVPLRVEQRSKQDDFSRRLLTLVRPDKRQREGYKPGRPSTGIRDRVKRDTARWVERYNGGSEWVQLKDVLHGLMYSDGFEYHQTHKLATLRCCVADLLNKEGGELLSEYGVESVKVEPNIMPGGGWWLRKLDAGIADIL